MSDIYALFSFLMCGVVVVLLWERYKLVKELNHAKTIAALMFAEKMGIKVGGKEVKMEIHEVEEREV